MSDFAAQKQMAIDENYEAFLKILPQLMKENPGRFVVMRHKKPEAFFDTARDAMIHAAKIHQDGLYSIQEITEKAVDLGWFSHAPILESV